MYEPFWHSSMHHRLDFCPDQTSQEVIKCTKAKSLLSSYIYCALTSSFNTWIVAWFSSTVFFKRLTVVSNFEFFSCRFMNFSSNCSKVVQEMFATKVLIMRIIWRKNILSNLPLSRRKIDNWIQVLVLHCYCTYKHHSGLEISSSLITSKFYCQIILRSKVLRHYSYLSKVIIQVQNGHGVLNRLVPCLKCMELKVSKSRKQFMVSSILPKNDISDSILSAFRSFFWENWGDHKLLSRFTDL